MELVQIHPLGDPQNGGVATFVGNWLGVEDYVMVNDDAVRFVREDERRDFIAVPSWSSRTTRCGFWWIPRTSGRPLGGDPDLVAKGHSFKGRHHRGLGDPDRRGSLDARRDHRRLQRLRGRRQDTQIAPGKELLGDAVSDPPSTPQAHPDHPLHHGRRVH